MDDRRRVMNDSIHHKSCEKDDRNKQNYVSEQQNGYQGRRGISIQIFQIDVRERKKRRNRKSWTDYYPDRTGSDSQP